MKLEFSQQSFEKHPNIKFINIRPVGTELFHEDRRTDMTKLIDAFRNFVNVPNNNNNNNNNEVKELQKTAILGTAHILWKVLM